MKRLRNQSFRKYLLFSELAALFAISALLLISLWLVLEQSNAAYLSLRLADAQKVHVFLEHQLIKTIEKINVFTAFPERERATSVRHLFEDFSDIYRVDDDLHVERIYKAVPGSKVFEGFSFAGGNLGAYLRAMNENQMFSGIMRGYEDSAPSIYYAKAHLGQRYVARINLITVQRFLAEFAQFSGTPLLLVAQDGFVMAASHPELCLYALDMIAWNKTPSAHRTLTAGNRTWIPAFSVSGKIGAYVVVLIPTTVPAMLQRALLIFYFGVMSSFSLLILVKYWLARRSLLRPISRFRETMELIKHGSFLLPDTDAAYRVQELQEMYASFRDMAAVIAQREQALKQSEERFRLAFENANVGMCLVDMRGRMVKANQQMSVMLGYRAEELEQMTVNDLALSDDEEANPSFIRQAIAGEAEHTEFEKQYRHRDGHLVWGLVKSSLLKDEQGHPLYFISHVQDITARKQAEAALRQSEARLRDAIEFLPIPIAISDQNGQLQHLNRTFADHYGYTMADIPTVADWFSKAYPDPDYRAEVLRQWDADVSDAIRHDRPTTPHEYCVTCKDGSRRDVEISMRLIGSLAVGCFNNVTERKQAEAALRDSEARFRSIFEYSGAGIAVSDLRGQIVFANPKFCEMLGYRADELAGRSFWEISHPEDRQAETIQILSVIRGEHPTCQVEKRYIRKDGAAVWGLLTVSVSRNAAGAAVSVVGQVQDLSERKAMEEALRESEARFRALFEQAKNAIVILDPATGKIIECNRYAHEHLGYAADEFLELPVEQDDRASFADMLTTLPIIAQGSLVFKTRQRHKSGELRDMEIHASRIAYQDQTFVLGIGYDITEQKQAEAELKLNEARLESLLRISQLHETALPPLLDFALEEAIQLTRSQIGYIYYYNETTRQFTLNSWSKGVMPQCSIAQPQTVYDLETTGIWGEAVRQRRPILVNDFHAPHPQKKGCPEGHVPLHKFLTIPVIVDGKIVAVTGVANKTEDYNQADVRQLQLLMDAVWNICQRKQYEENLRKFSRAVEQSGNTIIITDTTGAIEYVNPAFCRTTGYTEAEARGQNPRMLKSGQMLPELYADLWRTISQGGVWQGELLNRAKTGDLYWESATISPVKNPAGAITHYLAVKENITDRKRLEAELRAAKEAAEAANHAKSAFLANMSHELRTPLNGILGYAQILLRDADLTERQRSGLTTIQQSGAHLLRLINDILDLAKVEAGRVELMPTEVSLSSLLHGVCDMIRIRADAKGVIFKLDANPMLPQTIRADESRLRQALLNLLGNAVKFTERGSVTLRVHPSPESGERRDEALLRFEIVDTGIGIAPDDLPKLFKPFQQVGADKYKKQGTGLGLAISRNLIGLMGGELRVSSVLGQGSVFWFELPVPVVTPATVATHADTRQILGVVGQAPRILVVDDDATNRRMMTDALTLFGFDIQEAENGRVGLEICQRFQPHAIITDLRMPEMDGLTFIRHIRQIAAFQDIMIIVSSASAYLEDRQSSLIAGSQAFLPKPLDLQALLAALQQGLRLTWRYADAPSAADYSEMPEEVVLPPLATLYALHDFALIGDIEGVRTLLGELKQDARFMPFIAKLHPMVRGYNMGEILQLLKGYLTPTAPDKLP